MVLTNKIYWAPEVQIVLWNFYFQSQNSTSLLKQTKKLLGTWWEPQIDYIQIDLSF